MSLLLLRKRTQYLVTRMLCFILRLKLSTTFLPPPSSYACYAPKEPNYDITEDHNKWVHNAGVPGGLVGYPRAY